MTRGLPRHPLPPHTQATPLKATHSDSRSVLYSKRSGLILVRLFPDKPTSLTFVNGSKKLLGSDVKDMYVKILRVFFFKAA